MTRPHIIGTARGSDPDGLRDIAVAERDTCEGGGPIVIDWPGHLTRDVDVLGVHLDVGQALHVAALLVWAVVRNAWGRR